VKGVFLTLRLCTFDTKSAHFFPGSVSQNPSNAKRDNPELFSQNLCNELQLLENQNISFDPLFVGVAISGMGPTSYAYR
jgi:hypothetical protein